MYIADESKTNWSDNGIKDLSQDISSMAAFVVLMNIFLFLYLIEEYFLTTVSRKGSLAVHLAPFLETPTAWPT